MKFLGTIFGFLTVAVVAAGAEADPEIEKCADICWDFKIAPYLNVAKRLQEKGEEEAIKQLVAWSETRNHEEQVIILCRMLFEPREGHAFRSPRIGGPDFAGGREPSDWPLFPIDLFEGIPILICPVYSLSGRREFSSFYLRYCSENCVWRDEPYSIKSSAETNAIIEKWIEIKLSEPLDDLFRNFFLAQAGELR